MRNGNLYNDASTEEDESELEEQEQEQKPESKAKDDGSGAKDDGSGEGVIKGDLHSATKTQGCVSCHNAMNDVNMRPLCACGTVRFTDIATLKSFILVYL